MLKRVAKHKLKNPHTDGQKKKLSQTKGNKITAIKKTKAAGTKFMKTSHRKDETKSTNVKSVMLKRKKRLIEPESESGDEGGDQGEDEDITSSDEEDDTSEEKAPDQSDLGPPPHKKQRINKAELYKAPTSEELNQLKETENLFQSSLLRLQITELMSEVVLKDKKRLIIDRYISKLTKVLLSLRPGDKYELSDLKWLRQQKLKCPISQQPRSTKGVFHFLAPASVKSLGSYPLNLAIKPQPSVDLALKVPKECFQAKDHLNQRYLRKRALYLAAIACQLKSCDLIEDLSFTYHHGNHMRPVLLITPAASIGKGFTVQLHPYPAEDTFKMSRFHIAKNNIRASWFMEKQESAGDDGEVPGPATPHYNTWVLQDLVQEANQGYVEHVFGGSEGVKQGLVLLKVWLHQRQLDQGRGGFSGYIMTMYVTYLLAKRKLNIMMSSYQIMRNTLLQLCAADWVADGISLAADSEHDPIKPLLVDFQEAFEVVFVDRTGYVNLCCDMYKATFDRVKHEAALGVEFLSSSGSSSGLDSFSSLLMSPVDFFMTFDHSFHIGPLDLLPACLEKAGQTPSLLDHCGDPVSLSVMYIVQLLYKALGQRVRVVSVQLQPCKQWSVSSSPPPYNDATLTFGLLADKDHVSSIVEKGPSADTPQALDFREFWGGKSELRRFQDGSICEAVVWKGQTICERRGIMAKIVKHVLKRHAAIDKENITFVSRQIDSLLVLPQSQKAKSVTYGTGEEQMLHVHKCYDDLAKILRSLKDLPLVIHTIQGTSPVFRYAEVFPPMSVKHQAEKKSDVRDIYVPTATRRCPMWMPTVTVLCLLEASGKWPEDAEAVKRVKSAFLIKISQLLRKTHKLNCQMSAAHLDVFKDGFVFRIEIGYLKEVALLKMVTTPEGMVKMVDVPEATELQQRLVALPKLTSTLHGLHQQNNTFSCSVRLAKRWLSAHMLLDGYMTEETVELLVAYLYITPAPYTQPGSPLVGFLRFLKLLCSYDWQTSPLIVNLNKDLSREDISEIQKRFTTDRARLPPVFIATPKDRFISQWTKQGPTMQILQRLVLLAQESLAVIQGQLQQGSQEDLRQIFRPPLDQYDVIIHLNGMQLPRQHHAVDITTRTFLPQYSEYQSGAGREYMPVVNYNPVQRYLQELRESYADTALFFHDLYGGDMIAVLWKPTAFQPGPFKVTHIQGKMPVDPSSHTDTKVLTNVEAILEGFKVLGKGLVKNIESRTDNWKI